MNTNAAKIIDALGGTAEAARLFEVRMPSVSAWRYHGIPKPRMMFLQVAKPEALEGVDVVAATALSNQQPAIKTEV
ncbi:hypothetical protein F3K02_09145 [Hydrogenophaga sp. D2P1]|uniref:Rha family transcriptional regulator n=1 Tax=Hydrogenophaga aromaticivorans TaxID=2610898 RepID=A0A7Y8GV35_9BURK|nr:hypothetical protein [Hydrogenophaga aromaticivorans]NWF45411.1 hypothetical protein [Hydrogenophaga aromaticivorans]